MRVAIVLFGTVLLGATHSDAATIDNDRPGGTADYVRVKTVARDQDDKIVVTLEIDAGYHINANPATFDYLIPTTLNVTNLPPLRVSYPAPVRFKPKFVDEALNVYEGTVRITAEFAHGALSRNPYLFGTVTAQACTDVICLPPADLPLPHQ
ncbi:MAG TPA: protein-disulfide reductase DsbD domain-containing protein [Stellaceae bacterium]|nr:protein-disulfide reductase DsbD domain-containing protein [Stellaceae bacterium]